MRIDENSNITGILAMLLDWSKLPNRSDIGRTQARNPLCISDGRLSVFAVFHKKLSLATDGIGIRMNPCHFHKPRG